MTQSKKKEVRMVKGGGRDPLGGAKKIILVKKKEQTSIETTR